LANHSGSISSTKYSERFLPSPDLHHNRSVELKDWEGTIPASGDVIINIYHKGTKRSMPYTLEVTVR
jgi:hypothetical protein